MRPSLSCVVFSSPRLCFVSIAFAVFVVLHSLGTPRFAAAALDPSSSPLSRSRIAVGDDLSSLALLQTPGPVDSSTSGDGSQLAPPVLVTYRCRVVDSGTGLGVPGVVVRATEKVLYNRCWRMNQYGQCYDCQQTHEYVSRSGTSDAVGAVEIDFEHYQCEFVSDAPPEWDTTSHLSWEDGRVIEQISATGSSEWIQARCESGPEPYDHTLYVTHETELAERFSPVLHRHPEFELQADLADLDRTLTTQATLSAYNVVGSTLYGPAQMPPTHVRDSWHWDSHGRGQTVAYWLVDIDDDARRAGAPVGERSLYTHVFPWGEGVVIQYWLWMNGNDLTQQWGFAWHEGDWECLSIYALHENGAWRPERVNLSQHAGGESLRPEDCWWSASNAPSYAGIQQGASDAVTHPHVWVASNSHALYNRYSDSYKITIDAEYCPGEWNDELDYGWARPQPEGQSFFAYDRLVPMGEFVWSSQAHGLTWFEHCEGAALPELCLRAVFGEGTCDQPNECAFFPCELMEYFDVGDWFDGLALGPRSPLIPHQPHKWRDFVLDVGRWGNDNGYVSYEWCAPRYCDLGVFTACGPADRIDFEAIPRSPEEPGRARFRRVSGDATIFGYSEGNLPIQLIDGRYHVWARELAGVGEMEFSVYPLADASDPVAVSWRAQIAACPLTPSDVDAPIASDTRTEGAARLTATIGPSPARGPISIRFAHAPESATAVEIHDVSGSIVRRLEARAGQHDLAWDGRDDEGVALPGGLYLVSARDGDRRTVLGKVTLLSD